MVADDRVADAVALWEKHRPGLEHALEHGADNRQPADVYRAIVEERAQVWGHQDAMLITELYPDVYTVHVWLATGELDAVVDLCEQVQKWAAAGGYRKITMCGRPGWARVLRDDWTLDSVVLSKEI